MSASDAAPLPRLGEVFFDVRGNSRSMRLSWYADTGVAVMSIWQGGMCTGTFRLAIGDLPRLVETLQRGPAGRQAGWDSQAPGQAPADPLLESTAHVQSMEPLPGQGRPDLPDEPVDYLTGARDYPDRRPRPPEYLAEPPGHGARPAEHQTELPDYRTGPPDDVRTGPAPYRAGSADYLAGPPEYQPGPPEYPGPPDHRGGSREYRAEPPEYPVPPDHWGGSGEYQAGPPEYGAGPPEYQPGRPDHRGGSPDYRAGSPDYRAGSPRYGAGPREHQSGPPDHRAGPPEYQPGPPDHRSAPRDHRAEPPDHRADRAAPPRPRTEYLADLRPATSADPAGYGSAIYVGSRQPDASDPDTGGNAAYPHDTGGQVNYRRESAGDLYRGTGPLDYHDEPSTPHYPPGTSAPTRSDALGRSPADYPANYGTAVTDDIGHEPRQDSFPYGRSAGSRGARSRHADPDA